MTRLNLQVPDAHCGSCRAEIERALRSVAGVQDVEVDLRSRTVTTTFDDETVDPDTLRRRLTDAGYPPHDIHRDRKD